MGEAKKTKGDLMRQWLELTRELLADYYPEVTYAVLVGGMPSGLPELAIPVIPRTASAGPPPSPCASRLSAS